MSFAVNSFARLSVVCAVVSLSLSLSAFSAFAQAQDPVPLDPVRTDEDLYLMEAYFQANPQLMEERGSGWNPFNRNKWFYEARRSAGEIPGVADRYRVWAEKVAMEENLRARASWFEIGPVNLSGRILDIAFDPTNANVVYVGSASGGLWKSTNGGDTWIPVTDELLSLAIGGVEVLTSNPNIVLIATGEGTINIDRVGGVGILRSTDAGMTWNNTSLTLQPSSGSGFHAMESNPTTGTILAAARDGLYRSTDDGATWTNVNPGGDHWDVKWHAADPNIVYSLDGGFFGPTTPIISTDDGATWTNLTGSGLPDPFDVSKSKIGVTPDDPDVIYFHFSKATTPGRFGSLGVYRSTDGGSSFQLRSTPNIGFQSWYNLTLVVDPNNSNRVITGGVEKFRSTTGGTNFVETGDGFGLGTNTALHLDHHVAVYEPGSNTNLWVGTDGGVWKSTDDGFTWFSRREGINTYQFYDICVAQTDPSATLGGTQDNGVPGRNPGVQTWFVSNLFADGMVCNVDPTNEDVVYAEWQFGNHVKSTDGGGSWFSIQTGIAPSSGRWVTPVDLDQNDPNHLYTEADDMIYRSTNGGGNWTSVANHEAIWISISRVDGDYVWTVDSGSVNPRVTTNDGSSWTTTANYGFAIGTPTKIHAHPTDLNTAFVTFSGYGAGDAHIAMTTNLGASWTNVTGDLPSQPVNTFISDPANPNTWYIGTDVGVWQSTNGGTNWVPMETGLPNAVIEDLEIREVSRKLVAGTHGRGAWEVDISGGATDVALGGDFRSLNLMLDPPSPNPVRGQTILRFAAKYEGEVKLSIYDVQGRLITPVATIERGDGVIRMAPWHTDDISSGVYFAVLEAGSERLSRKLVVTK